MYFLRFCIFVQALSIALSFDVELEGIIRLADDFFNQLTTKPYVYSRQGRKNPIISRSSVMRANTVAINKTKDLGEFKDHLIQVGVKALYSVTKQLEKKMNIKNDFSLHIHAVHDEYVRTMHDYYQFICEQKNVIVIDEEFLFLDLIETACRLLYREERKLLNDAIITANVIENHRLNLVNTTKDIYNVTDKANIREMNQVIFKQGIRIKTEEFRYICNRYDICRPYPGFTDYLADLLVEILRLPKDEFKIFSRALLTVGSLNRKFFKKICSKTDLEKIIMPQIPHVFNNTKSLTEYFLLIRGIIIQRFKLIHTQDLKLKFRTQAMRILFDIIDKAFESEGPKVLYRKFNTVVQNIRNRNGSHKEFPESSVSQLLKDIIRTLDNNLDTNAKKEISVLIETILKGSSGNKIFRTLFDTGSKFVKEEDDHVHFV